MLLAFGFILSVFLHLLLGILLLILGILLLVLFIPITYVASGYRYEEDAAAEGSFSWLFGLVSMAASFDGIHGFRMRLMLFSRWTVKSFNGMKSRTRKEKEKRKEKRNAKMAGSARGKKERRKFHLTAGKLKLMEKAGVQVLKQLLPRQVVLDCRVGFENPAHTGMLCAALAPLHSIPAGKSGRSRIRLIPVFDESDVSGNVCAHGRIMIWFIVWEALKLAISKPFRQDIFPRRKPRNANKQVSQRNGFYQGESTKMRAS